MRGRHTKEVQIKVSEAELDALEDALTVWNLRKKHKSMINATEKEFATAQVTCPYCLKERKRIFKKALAMQSRLWKAYDI